MFTSIPQSKNCISIESLEKGWSKDKKYHILSKDGNEYLLRISDISLYEKKKAQFELLKKVAQLDIHASKPISFGQLNENEIYLLLTYLSGKSAEEVIPKLSKQAAYELGIEAGQVLKKLHSIDIGLPKMSWWEQYQIKIPRKINKIKNCQFEVPKCDLLIDYIEKNMDLVKNQKLSFTHGDYHVGNMIVDHGHIGIIDFDKSGVADSYDEFKPFCWNVYVSEYFQSGLINGYFNNQVPEEFFKILSLYAAESLISHLPWAMTYGEKEIQTAYRVMKSTFEWYDDFKRIIPTWYKGVLYEDKY